MTFTITNYRVRIRIKSISPPAALADTLPCVRVERTFNTVFLFFSSSRYFLDDRAEAGVLDDHIGVLDDHMDVFLTTVGASLACLNGRQERLHMVVKGCVRVVGKNTSIWSRTSSYNRQEHLHMVFNNTSIWSSRTPS